MSSNSSNNYQFIGPLKPGQKAPQQGSYANNDTWTIFDLLTSNNNFNSESGQSYTNPKNSQASSGKVAKVKKSKKFFRAAGGTTWEDPTLAEWDPDDYRVFVGDLGNDVTDALLKTTFEKYPSFVKGKVLRDKRTNKSKGYGFISFRDASDYARAIKEWDGKYLGCRPIKLRKSLWKDRALDQRKAEQTATSSTDLLEQ